MHMAIAVGVLPSDLGEDPVEGVRLLEVREGLLRVRQLGGLLTHQLNDEVLGALGELGVAAVGIHAGGEGRVLDGVEGVFDPCKEGLVLAEQAALGRSEWGGALVWEDGLRAQEPAIRGFTWAVGCVE